MVRVSSPAKLRPWSELTAKMVMGVVPGLVIHGPLHCTNCRDDVKPVLDELSCLSLLS